MNKSRLPFILLLAALQGCVTMTEPGLLVPDASIGAVRSESPLRGTIALGEVRAGKRVDIMGHDGVGDRELAEALRRSLGSRGLLAEQERASRYRLTAIVADVTLGAVGYDVTGRALVRYTLYDGTGAVVLDELVRSSYTVTLAQELGGQARSVRAMEGMYRSNIATFLERLARFRPSNAADRPGPGGAAK